MTYQKTAWVKGVTKLSMDNFNNIENGINNILTGYEKTNWQDGDVITADRLNKIEDAIANVNPGVIDFNQSQMGQVLYKEYIMSGDVVEVVAPLTKSGLPEAYRKTDLSFKPNSRALGLAISTGYNGETYEVKQFLYNNGIPVIVNVSVTSSLLGGGDYAYVNGMNFDPECKVMIGDKNAQIQMYYDTTRIRIKLPAQDVAGQYDVHVFNPDGGRGTLPKAINYVFIPVESLTSFRSTGLDSAANNLVTYSFAPGDTCYIFGDNFATGMTIKTVCEDGTTQFADVLNVYDKGRGRIKLNASLTHGKAILQPINPDGIPNPHGELAITIDPVPLAVSIKLTSSQGTASTQITSATAGQILYMHGKRITADNTMVLRKGDQEMVLDALSFTTGYLRFQLPENIEAGEYTFLFGNKSGVKSETNPITIPVS